MKKRAARTAHHRRRVAEVKGVQLTVRNVPHETERALRRRAADERKSLNRVLVEALTREAGVGLDRRFHDLDVLIGTWVEDPAFDQIMAEQDKVDEELWR